MALQARMPVDGQYAQDVPFGDACGGCDGGGDEPEAESRRCHQQRRQQQGLA
jgi:hypothetical protein